MGTLGENGYEFSDLLISKFWKEIYGWMTRPGTGIVVFIPISGSISINIWVLSSYLINLFSDKFFFCIQYEQLILLSSIVSVQFSLSPQNSSKVAADGWIILESQTIIDYKSKWSWSQ